MGDTLLTIAAVLAVMAVFVGLVIFVASRFGLFRQEKVTVQMRAIADPTADPARQGAAPPTESAPLVPRLRETSAPKWAARRIALKSVSTLTIGRSSENDLVLPEDAVSAKHCRLEPHEGSFRVVDLGSTNRTWVNGKDRTEAVLQPGDQLRVGTTTFVFELAPDRE